MCGWRWGNLHEPHGTSHNLTKPHLTSHNLTEPLVTSSHSTRYSYLYGFKLTHKEKMKRNFYLQHPLMAMYDPRMEYLLEKEKLKGTGAYWFVIEKLAMLPDSCGDMKYLRPFCKDYKISFAYLKKIIFGYGLFDFEEDGSFMPAELNPIGQRVQVRKEIDGDEDEKREEIAQINTSKTFKNASESSVFEPKNDEKQQKTSEKNDGNNAENSVKVLSNSAVYEKANATNKENIKDIITTSSSKKEKEKTAVDDDDDFSNAELHCPFAGLYWLDATLHRPHCRILAGEMPHPIACNATPRTCSSVAFPPFRCGIADAEVWHWKSYLHASLSLPQRSTAVTAKYLFAVQKRTGAYVYSVPCTRWAMIFSGLEVSTG